MHDAGSGNIRIWKDCTSKGNQKLLVTTLSFVQGHIFGRLWIGSSVYMFDMCFTAGYKCFLRWWEAVFKMRL